MPPRDVEVGRDGRRQGGGGHPAADEREGDGQVGRPHRAASGTRDGRLVIAERGLDPGERLVDPLGVAGGEGRAQLLPLELEPVVDLGRDPPPSLVRGGRQRQGLDYAVAPEGHRGGRVGGSAVQQGRALDERELVRDPAGEQGDAVQDGRGAGLERAGVGLAVGRHVREPVRRRGGLRPGRRLSGVRLAARASAGPGRRAPAAAVLLLGLLGLFRELLELLLRQLLLPSAVVRHLIGSNLWIYGTCATGPAGWCVSLGVSGPPGH
mmetsp:Transcript_13294/g.28925  ORF Transcript_13294/g.28925 Transcript_13294/m.28925 type:complete len:266 (+) Transcript_13294:1882-2679(+)